MSDRDSVARHKVRHDLLFTEACNIGSYISIKDVKHEVLHPVWYTFQDSIESVRVMSLLPQAVMSAAIRYLLPLSQAVSDVLGKPVMDDSDFDQPTTQIDARFSDISDHFFDNRPQARLIYLKNLVMYNKRNLVNSELTRGGFFALLEAQLIGVWAAFDALTTDLCVAVVNEKPELLEKLGDKQTTLTELLQHAGEPDWTGRMGELIKVFVRFDSFKGTKDAYKKIFNDKSISAILESKTASVACLVRTQITHDAGLVTDNFVKQAKRNNAAPWSACHPGERLPLDGKNVAALSESIIQCANDLIRAVDGWLHLPPPVPVAK